MLTVHGSHVVEAATVKSNSSQRPFSICALHQRTLLVSVIITQIDQRKSDIIIFCDAESYPSQEYGLGYLISMKGDRPSQKTSS